MPWGFWGGQWHSFPPVCLQVVRMMHLTRQEYRDAVGQLNMYRGDWHLKGTGEFLVLRLAGKLGPACFSQEQEQAQKNLSLAVSSFPSPCSPALPVTACVSFP